MTTTTNRKPHQRIPALCCECGTVRECAFNSVLDTRVLKCATCLRVTRHATVKPERFDVNEHLNAKDNEKLVELERTKRRMERMGVWVLEGTPQGGKCDVRNYIDGDEPAWCVTVSTTLPVREQLDMLRWAWKHMVINALDGPVCHDRYGEFHGYYYIG